MTSFRTLGLPAPLLQALEALGYEHPTAIQAKAIPALMAGHDVTGVAQTGTGKTAAFGLPLLASIDPCDRRVQALVLAPTRELAMQVARAIESFAADIGSITVAAVYGGAPMGPQLSALRRGAQIVVGTPGRIIDHLDRGTLQLDAVRYAVIDEADEMLRMGFAEDVDRILSDAPAERQTALFSATMPDAIRRVARRHLREPIDVSVAASGTSVATIRQRYALLPYRQKTEALKRILAVTDAEAAVVFVRTRRACDEVGAELLAAGIRAAVISGDVSQAERERTMAHLRNRQVDVLVATDVAARGLDVERIGLVVNFDAPREADTYVHRVGRTGRAGRSGDAVLFVTPKEKSRLRAIERATGQKLEKLSIPSPADVAAHRATAALGEAATRLTAGRLDSLKAAVATAVGQADVTVDDLAAALLAVAIGDDGTPESADQLVQRGYDDDHGTARGSNRDGRSGRKTNNPKNTEPGTPYVVQVGRRHGVRPAAIVGAIAGEGNLPGSAIGRITIRDNHSIVELCQPVRAESLARIGRATVSGQRLRIRREHDGTVGQGSHRQATSAPHRTASTSRPRHAKQQKPRAHAHSERRQQAAAYR